MKGSIFLISITTIMFIISTVFLAIDFADLVIRLRMILNANTAHTLEDKAAMATNGTRKLRWMEQLLFIIGVCHPLPNVERANRHCSEAESRRHGGTMANMVALQTRFLPHYTPSYLHLAWRLW
jgi:hypothetical protein